MSCRTYGYYDDDRYSVCFKSNRSRLFFLQRVFMILISAMLAILGQLILVLIEDSLKSFMTNIWLSLVGGILFITTCITASCSNISRSCFPWNFFLLIVLIESLSLLLAPIICIYGENIILISIASQTFVIFLLLFFTFTTFIDFTSWTAIFIVLLSIILTFAAVWTASLEFFHFKQTEIFYSIIVVIVLSLGLLINIQIIFNEAIFELCPNDYIFGSLLIFSDIIIVMMCCLKLSGFDTDECC